MAVEISHSFIDGFYGYLQAGFGIIAVKTFGQVHQGATGQCHLSRAGLVRATDSQAGHKIVDLFCVTQWQGGFNAEREA